MTDLFTCEADLPTTTTKVNPAPATTTPGGHDGGWGSSSHTGGPSGGNGGWGSSSNTVGPTGGDGGWGSSSHTGGPSGGNGGWGSSSTTGTGGNGGWGSSSTTGTTTDGHEHPGTTTSPVHPETTTSHDGHDTTSSHSVPSGTTSTGQSTSVSGTTTSQTTTSATTTSSCGPTASSVGIDIPTCNNAENRGRWCGSRSVDDDTHTTFQTGNTKRYTLTITSELIDFDGTPKSSFAINGKTPGEPIIANWGDMVEVTVINGLTDNATTIHWHGIRQTGSNDQDGVPGVTECGIAPGTGRTYTWHASTYGTGWYHSHALAQYGGGIRGPIIIHGPATANYDYDMGTIMVDETFSQTIFQMAWNIARVRGALPASTNYLLNGKNKSPDGSTGESARWVVKKGKKHLFRIINSAAQSAFAVRFDNHKIKVVSADFTPVVPYDTEVLWIQPGQRYNVILEANQPDGAYFLRAVSQTGCGATSLNNGLGNSNGIFTYEGACAATPVSSNATIVTAGICNDEPLASLVPHFKKSAGSASEFQQKVKLLPAGNAGSQVFDGFGSILRWYLGGASTDLSTNSATPAGSKTINVTFEEPTLKTLSTLPGLAYNSSLYGNSAVLDGPANEWVYFVIQNNFQTSHPMHLHGHDFSVLGQGRGVFTSDMVGQLNFDNPIRRDTALLFGGGSPTAFISGWTVIGFETDNPGAWVMHCHLIWHADGGMGLQYLERPAEIKDYYGAEFKQECSNYDAYRAAGGHDKHPYEAGFKRHLSGRQGIGHSHGNVLRH
ncbi:uncharacterized protein A1O9_02625 [Exophiala aquamarina CBS 119918]|uniref:laccase n=1 Tax=Exophiala aquamarina CBS 119918 TaxID=1182545 RepID=A0A072PZJ0_9EURO|nr:uncharacterized protein A1O9_02625 [Exophiala aquamarina CBS 119918]KEF61060.1 hypothetical protein A1O9_02625 [Exophiala aquamarina CBS 119918]